MVRPWICPYLPEDKYCSEDECIFWENGFCIIIHEKNKNIKMLYQIYKRKKDYKLKKNQLNNLLKDTLTLKNMIHE